jgi:membrane protein
MRRPPSPFGRAVLLARAVGAGWQQHDGERMAAALAFYALFSIAPALLITTSLLGFWMGAAAAQGQLVSQLMQWMGPEMAATVLGLVQRAHKPDAELTAAAVGVATLIWTSTRGFAQLQAALDVIFDAGKGKGALAGALRQRALAFTLVIGLGLLMGISAALNATISALSRWSEGLLPVPSWLAYGIGDASSFVTLGIAYTGVYQLLPRQRAPLPDTVVGALFAAALFTAGRHALGIYLAAASPGSAYGASGSLVVLLLWLYYSALILLLGAEVVATRVRMRRAAATAGEPAGRGSVTVSPAAPPALNTPPTD